MSIPKIFILFIVATSVVAIILYYVRIINSGPVEVKVRPFDDKGFKLSFENYHFYGYFIVPELAIAITGIFNALGVTGEVEVTRGQFDRETQSGLCDFIIGNGVYIDYDSPVYSINNGSEYYVWEDSAGMLHGLSIDKENDVIELR